MGSLETRSTDGLQTFEQISNFYCSILFCLRSSLDKQTHIKERRQLAAS